LAENVAMKHDTKPPGAAGVKPVFEVITPSEAKLVWDAMGRPSARRVARKFSQAGRPIHFATIARWKARGWRPVARKQHPILAASLEIDVATPVLTGDVLNDLYTRKVEALEGLSNNELVEKVSRELMITLILLLEEVQRQGQALVAKPLELAVLLRALSNSYVAVAKTFEQIRQLKTACPPAKENGIESDPLAEELKAWGRVAGIDDDE